ncbi:transcription factor 25 [Cephus cinctus]|uniref:Transcription factor 25 n=1 Tax=Cephus cinctus TaxID=211228 RepID=A0AAJ7CDK4_CEPCN|nr:transcription factor 25 [Cephus cinctus]XP_015607562.1 transcription factor 25 [Cephus cinctus]
MSTRYMKKVYGGDVGLENNNENLSDTEIPITGVKPKQFNVFDLLNQNSENEAKDDDDEGESENPVIDTTVSEVSKRKKKKKKKHKKLDSSRVQQSSRRSSENNEEVDEIERTVREVNKLLGEPTPGCSQDIVVNELAMVPKAKENTLTIQHKHLNTFNELKRIFGTKTIQAEQSKRRDRDRVGHLKKTWLISARHNWPPIGKSGISMSIDQSIEYKGNVQYFVFEHNSTYIHIQKKFLQVVESMDPQNIIKIVNAHPYHVDGLLQLSELCKMSEDLAMAAELVERALYSLECAFHPLFNITTATCRLDYKKQQNRAFFITLFKHLLFVGGRACYRTSLELCKLLLSLDPEGDPLAIILALDLYALRGREYTWFVEFCETWESTRNLTQLPNMAYGLALCHFHLGNKEAAEELLQNALIMFPGVLIPLLDKCSVQTDSRVLGHDFFNSKAAATTPPALEKLQTLYVYRSYHLWKETDILSWLEAQVHIVLNRVDSEDDYVKYCTAKRSKRYQGKLPMNIARHIILSDIKEVTFNVQEMQNGGSILSHDPLPPTDSIDLYSRPTPPPRTNHNNSNLFSLFFSSLFMDLDGDVAIAAANGFNLFDENARNDDHD